MTGRRVLNALVKPWFHQPRTMRRTSTRPMQAPGATGAFNLEVGCDRLMIRQEGRSARAAVAISHGGV
jgi:hypothetical protein